MSRLKRFLNLEPPREAVDPPGPRVEARERYTPAPELVTVPRDDDAQPFVRCPSCEADNLRHATRCLNCQRGLDDEGVREWNRAFWEKRRAGAETPAPVEPPPALEAIPEEPLVYGRNTPGARFLRSLPLPLRGLAAGALLVLLLFAMAAAFFGRGPTRLLGILLAASLAALFLPLR